MKKAKNQTGGVKLGDRCRDEITGFEGIATGKYDYLYGCCRIQLQPDKLDDKGRPLGSEVFDEAQLVVIEAGARKGRPPVAATSTGGPRETPPQRETPIR